MGIAGNDYCIMAADCRLASVEQFAVRSRNISRIFEVSCTSKFGILSSEAFISSKPGAFSVAVDAGLTSVMKKYHTLLSVIHYTSFLVALCEFLKLRSERFRWENNRPMNTDAFTSLLSYALYQRRFMPYYSFCAFGGLDAHGRGKLVHFDAVGSAERVRCLGCGKGEALLQPLLDKLTRMESDASLWCRNSEKGVFLSEANEDSRSSCALPLSAALELVKEAFEAAAERESSIGDGVQILVLQRDGPTGFSTRRLFHPLPSH